MRSTGKIMYGIDSVGLDGELKKFEKPIFQTWLMFFSMIFALPIQWIYHWHVERKWHKTRTGRTSTQRRCFSRLDL